MLPTELVPCLTTVVVATWLLLLLLVVVVLIIVVVVMTGSNWVIISWIGSGLISSFDWISACCCWISVGVIGVAAANNFDSSYYYYFIINQCKLKLNNKNKKYVKKNILVLEF